MKRFLLLVIVCICVTACKKEVPNFKVTDAYLEQVKTVLMDSIGTAQVEQFDFSRAIRSDVDSMDLHFLNIPFRGTGTKNFVLLQTDKLGNIRQGRLVAIKRESPTRQAFNGTIVLRSLKQEVLLQSVITDGSIVALHQRSSGTMQQQLSFIQPSGSTSETLPEVVVIGYRDVSGGISYSEWINLESLFGSSSGSLGNYFSPMDGSYGGYSDYGGSNNPEKSPVELERETVYSLPAINLSKAFQCFEYVPSSGATFKIKLCTDLPSNSDPYASSTFFSVSAGHTFLTITKSNNDQSVTQSFGFYPQTAPSWFNPTATVSSTIRDNGAQEINGSIEMNINESQFNIIKSNAINWSTRQYDLDDYNCTNYALDVFNSVRSTPITVQPYKVILPGSTDAYNPAADPISILIDNSPQMLFSKLRDMKYSNNAESSNILIDQSHNSRAPISKGECD